LNYVHIFTNEPHDPLNKRDIAVYLTVLTCIVMQMYACLHKYY